MNSSPLLIRTLIVLILIAIQPIVWSFVKSAAEEMHNQQTYQEQLALATVKLSDATRAMNIARSSVSELPTAFPSKQAVSQVVGQLETLADSKKITVQIQGIEAQPPLEGQVASDSHDPTAIAGPEDAPQVVSETFSGIAPYLITARVAGPVDAIFAFMELLEHERGLVAIQSFNLTADTAFAANPSPSPAISPSPRFSLVMNILYYFYDAPKN